MFWEQEFLGIFYVQMPGGILRGWSGQELKEIITAKKLTKLERAIHKTAALDKSNFQTQQRKAIK